jgi:XTP/dITP diphosphohydrolase
MIKEWVLASSNRGKLEEINQLLHIHGVVCRPQADFGIVDIPEPYTTFLENALHKARYVSQLTGLPSLADDSGLCVPALRGAPGVWSARFAGEPVSNSRNIKKLLENMENVQDRRAYFYCILVFLRYPEDPTPLIGDGLWHGEIAQHAKGDGGFGYDSIFYIPNERKTVAEMSADKKQLLSHRSQAMGHILKKIMAGDIHDF